MKENVISIVGAVAALMTILGVVHGRQPLIAISAFSITALAAALLAVRALGNRIRGGHIEIEGVRIDSLNLANISRTTNATLRVDRVLHAATIYEHDLRMTYEYSGTCDASQGESGCVFCIHADRYIRFEDLDCFGYDLMADPHRVQKIRPILLGTDGIAKKVRLPFARRLAVNERFHTELHVWWPDCMAAGKDYFASTLAFEKEGPLMQYIVRLEFRAAMPRWVRVYDVSPQGRSTLVGSLTPRQVTNDSTVYQDDVMGAEVHSVRVYLFERLMQEK